MLKIENKILKIFKSHKLITLSIYISIEYKQSCYLSKETTDVTVTRGTLWSDKV